MKQFFLPMRTLMLNVLLFSTVVVFNHAAFGQNVTLYTPYTKISVPPGQSIDYAIDVIRNLSILLTADTLKTFTTSPAPAIFGLRG
jgi:hypothetical protein